MSNNEANKCIKQQLGIQAKINIYIGIKKEGWQQDNIYFYKLVKPEKIGKQCFMHFIKNNIIKNNHNQVPPLTPPFRLLNNINWAAWS